MKLWPGDTQSWPLDRSIERDVTALVATALEGAEVETLKSFIGTDLDRLCGYVLELTRQLIYASVIVAATLNPNHDAEEMVRNSFQDALLDFAALDATVDVNSIED